MRANQRDGSLCRLDLQNEVDVEKFGAFEKSVSSS